MKKDLSVPPLLSAVHYATEVPYDSGITRPENDGTGVASVSTRLSDFPIRLLPGATLKTSSGLSVDA